MSRSPYWIAKISFKLLTIFAKSSILDIWQDGAFDAPQG